MSRSKKSADRSLDDDDDFEFQPEQESRQLKSHADRLVAAYAKDLKGPDVLVVLLHGTRLASILREHRPDVNFTFYTPEHFFYRTLQQFHSTDALRSDRSLGRTSLVCAADPPEQTFDEAIYPTLAGDSSEQAQELIQTVHQRLKSGGRLFISTNNPKDRWVQTQLKSMFSSVTVEKQKHGVVCVATKTVPLKKPRGFRARSAYRLGERLIFCESRPGVFSHRRIDGGARALIKSLALLNPPALESAGVPASAAQIHKIVEMGCGCGAATLAAAVEFPGAQILGVDSDARAVECTDRSAELNGITNVSTRLTSDGVIPDPGTWDLMLGNPPYYSDYRIAELFLQTAKTSLQPGGRIHLVTKLTEWHEARMRQLFDGVEPHTFGEYTVFTARQRSKK
jgi:16S rRNA G1207 methylase RsmC